MRIIVRVKRMRFFFRIIFATTRVIVVELFFWRTIMFGGFWRVAAFSIFCGAPFPALAEQFTIGQKGGVYCKTPDDLTKQMTLAPGGAKEVVPGCGMLRRGLVLDPAEIRHSSGMTGGVGVSPEILGGKPFPFITLGDDGGGKAASSAIDDDPATTAAALAAASTADDLVRVAAGDLEAQTHKWVGKVVETKLGCFYADVDEFRCFSGRFRVDFATFFPAAAQSAIQRDCDTISKSQRRSCVVTLRFKYVDYAPMDMPGFVGRINVVTAKDNVGYIVKK